MRNDPPPPSIELRLEPDQLALYWMPTAAPAAGNTEPYSVALGWQTVAQAFGLRMPTPLSLENAIATVEDAVMPAGRWLTKPPAGIAPPFTLHTRSPLLREIAEAAGVTLHTPPARLSRQAVENLFNRLSDQIHRPGVPDTALPQRAEWAAALLILREGLHHWGVEWVELG
uniref:hypothetical protein n=1 Tax=uncultured Acidovorax sp. TaxID=158751 RepID=UPI0030F4DE82